MKRIFLLLTILASLCVSAQEPFFQYPSPPESIEGFYPRCNYIVEHFWDRCDMKTAFSSKAKFKNAFNDYVSFAIYAGKDTVSSSVERLIKEVGKQPKNLLTLGLIAEECLYSDTTEIYSEELYYPFAKAVATCKKISAADRARFVRQEKILANTQVGMVVPDFTFTTPDGSTKNFRSEKGKRTFIIFSDPGCEDCRMLFVRLSADFNLRKLIDKGYIKLAVITPGEADDEWKAAVSSYPEEWVVGASEDVDEYFDLESLPATYYLDTTQKILSKSVDTSRLIEMFRVINANIPD